MEDFEIIKTLGKGTFGRVELAMHKQTLQMTAIKILLKSKIKSPQDHTHIARQISILKHLQHPNIVKLLYHFEDQTAIYLVMEHCQNGDLLHYLKDNKKIKQKEAAKFIYQLVDGIKYMHDNRVAHRDIKLGNILLDKNLTVKIADFGLSNFYEPGSKLKTSCGSPCFASPEVIAGNSYQPRKSDVWSIGIVLYTLLAGTLPFYHQNIFDLYSMVFNGTYNHINGITKNASDLISRLLQVDTTKRIQLSMILTHSFFQTYSKIKKLTSQKNIKKQLESQRSENIKQILTEMKIPQKQIAQVFKSSQYNEAYLIKQLLLKMDDQKFSTFVQNNKKQKRLNKSGQQIIKIKRNPLNIANINNNCKKSIIFKSVEDQDDKNSIIQNKITNNGATTLRSSVSSQLGRLERKSQQNVFVRSAKRIVRKSVLNSEKAQTYIKLKTNEEIDKLNREPLTNRLNTLHNIKPSTPVLSMHNSTNQITDSKKKSVDKRKLYAEETGKTSKNGEIIDYFGPYNIDSLIYNNVDYIRYRIQKMMLKNRDVVKISENTYQLISKQNSNEKRNKLNILRLNGIQGVHLLQIQPHCPEILSEVLTFI